MANIRLVHHNSCRHEIKGFCSISSHKKKVQRSTRKTCNTDSNVIINDVVRNIVPIDVCINITLVSVEENLDLVIG